MLAARSTRAHKKHRKHRLRQTSQENPQIVIMRNEQAQMTGTEQDANYDKLCEIRQGYLYQMMSMPRLQNQEYILELRPVFVVVNKHSISLFENQNVNALVANEQIHQTVNCMPYKFTNINCFQCGYNVQYPYFGSKDGIVDLCSRSLKSAVQWITAIQEYPHCEVRVQNQY